MSEKLDNTSYEQEKFSAINKFRGDGPVPHGNTFESISYYFDIIKSLPWSNGWTSEEIVELSSLAADVAGSPNEDQDAHGYTALKDNKDAEKWLQEIMDRPLP